MESPQSEPYHMGDWDYKGNIITEATASICGFQIEGVWKGLRGNGF
jgi:hypothetical protein